MSITFARPRAAMSRLRGFVLLLAAMAVALVGVAGATPASAAVHTLSGTGIGSAEITLSAGLYNANLSYENNYDGRDEALFGALLNSEDESVIEFLALDRKWEWSSSRVVQLFDRTTVRLDVLEAAPEAAWTLTLEKLSVPNQPQSGLSFRSMGLSSSPLTMLKAGNYQVTTNWTGNVHEAGLEEFQQYGLIIDLYGAAGDDRTLAESTKSSGSVTRTLTISKSGLYWVNPVLVATDAVWSVKMVALKNLTAPTPKISGTAKVGKKLTAKPGTWTSGAKLSYQWYRGSSKISGATKSTYQLTSKDKGKKVIVKVTGSKSGYLTVTKASKATATVKK